MIFRKTLGMVDKVLTKESVGFRNKAGDNKSFIGKSQKGFTLVELIVVLVILAILAAVAIPAMLGFIDNAREKKDIQNAKASLKATESALTEIYNDGNNRFTPQRRAKAEEEAGVGENTGFTVWTKAQLRDGKTESVSENIASYTVAYAEYTTADGKIVVYNGSDWTIYDNKDDASTDAVYSAVDSNNVIYVWPYNSDTAYNPGKSFDNSYGWGGGSSDYEFSDAIAVTFKGNDMVGFSDGLSTSKDLTLLYDRDEGFGTELDKYSVVPDSRYDSSSLVWKCILGAVSYSHKHDNAGEDPYVNIKQFLYDNFDPIFENNNAEITFVADMEHGYIPVTVSFNAYDDNTQSVWLKGQDGNSFKYEYDMVDRKLKDTGLDSITAAIEVKSKIEDDEPGAITYSEKWLKEDESADNAETYKEIELSDSSIEEQVKLAAEASIEAGDETAEVSFVTPADINKKIYLTALDEDKDRVTFEGNSDHYETIFSQNEYDSTIYEVKDGIKIREIEITQDNSSKKVTGVKADGNDYCLTNKKEIEENESNIEYGQIKLKNGKTKDYYPVAWNIYDCSFSEPKNIIDKDSVERITDKSKRYDCTNDIIDRIFGSGSDKSKTYEYGVNAQVDAEFLNSMLKYHINNSAYTVDNYGTPGLNKTLDLKTLGTDSLWKDFNWLVEQDVLSRTDERKYRSYYVPQIARIKFVKSDEYWKDLDNGDVVRSTSISIVGLDKEDDGERLKYETNENGERDFVKSGEDIDLKGLTIGTDQYNYRKQDLEDYPSYIVAYSSPHNTTDKEKERAEEVKQEIIDLYNDSAAIKRRSIEGDFYYPNDNDYQMYDIKVFVEDDDLDYMKAKLSLVGWFMNFCNMTECDITEHIETSEVLSSEDMFYGCRSLEELRLDAIDTSQARVMSRMFLDCESLTNKRFNLGKFSTESNVWFGGMFLGCKQLTRIGDEKLVLSLKSGCTLIRAFAECENLESIILDGDGNTYLGGDSTNEENKDAVFTETFYGCENLKSVTVKNFNIAEDNSGQIKTGLPKLFSPSSVRENIESVTFENCTFPHVSNVEGLFQECKALKKVNMSGLTIPAPTSTANMFKNCSKLTYVDFGGFDASNVTNTKSMFEGCSSLTGLDDEDSDSYLSLSLNGDSFLEHVTDMSYMFKNCTKLETVDEIRIDKAETIQEIFSGCNALKSIKFTGGEENECPLNTDKSHMKDILLNCPNVTKVEIDGLNFTQLNTLNNFFSGTKASLQTASIKGVIAPKVTSVQSMFNGFTALNKVEIENTTLLEVTTLKQMFDGASSLKYVSMNGFSAPNVTDVSFMFRNCTSLTGASLAANTSNKLDLRGLLPGNVTTAESMFQGCTSLSTTEIAGLNTTGLVNMKNMFNGCISLTEVQNFHIDSASNVNSLFASCTKLEEVTLTGSSVEGGYSVSPLTQDNDTGTIFNGTHIRVLTIKDIEFDQAKDADDNQNTAIQQILESAKKQTDSGKTKIKKTGLDTEYKETLEEVYFSYVYLPNVKSLWKLFGNSTDNNPNPAARNLSYVDLSGLHAPELVSIKHMFRECHSLKPENINMTGFILPNVTNFYGMFGKCSSFTTFDSEKSIPGFTTRYAENLTYLMDHCTNLASAEICIDNATTIERVFYGCGGNLNTVTFKGTTDETGEIINSCPLTNVSNNMNNLFYDCGGVKSVTVQGLNFINLNGSGLNNFFRSNDAYKNLETATISHVIAPNVTSVSGMFNGSIALNKVVFDDTTLSGVTTLKQMFDGASSLKYVSMNGFLAPNVTDVSFMFRNCTSLTGASLAANTSNKLDLRGLLPGNVTTAESMFQGCTSLSTTEITGLDTTKLANMKNMFNGCKGLSTATVNIDSATTINSIFANCSPGLNTVKFVGNDRNSCPLTTASYGMDNVLQNSTSVTKVEIKGLNFAVLTSLNNFFSGAKSSLQEVCISGLEAPKVTSLKQMFNGFSNLNKFTISNSNLNAVTDISYMFQNCSNLEDVSFKGSSFTKALYLDHMFKYCSAITFDNIGFSKTDFPASGIDAQYMFEGCTAITKVDEKSFNKLTFADGISNANGMFYGNPSLTEATGICLKNATSMNKMFAGCTSLEKVELVGGGEASSSPLTDIGNDRNNIFDNCTSLKEFSIRNYSFSSLTTLNNFFVKIKGSLETVNIDVEMPKLTSMSQMFKDATKLKTVTFGNSFTTEKVTNMSGMFQNCYSLESLDISGFDTANVTNMSNMFNSCYSLTALDISSFDTSGISSGSNLNDMFGSSSNDSVNNKTESNLTTIYASESTEVAFKKYPSQGVFGAKLTKLTGGNDTTFDTVTASGDGSNKYKSKYGRIDGKDGQIGYFKDCVKTKTSLKKLGDNWTSIFNIRYKDITNFIRSDLSEAAVEAIADKVIMSADDAEYLVYMWKEGNDIYWWTKADIIILPSGTTNNLFKEWNSVTRIDLQGFDTSNMTSMENMFMDCYNLTDIDLSSFDTSNVTSMSNMFRRCRSLTGTLDLSSFSSERLTNTESMFYGWSGSEYALNVKEIIFGDEFTCSSVTNMSNMFCNCKQLKELDISHFNTAKVTTMKNMFCDCIELGTIYASEPDMDNNTGFIISSGLIDNAMFNNCNKLKGGNGTEHTDNNQNKVFAVIDTAEHPGFFTAK